MNVRVTNERMVFAVSSETSPKREYRVDLLANNGASRCSCTDFGCRRQPALDAGGEPWTKDTRCKHAAAALRFFVVDLLKIMAAQENEAKQRSG